jgi:hypothetical protein
MTPTQTQTIIQNEVVRTPSGTALNQAIIHSQTNLDTALKTIFPSTQEETKVQKARKIMGSVVDELSDQQLQNYLTEFQYLVDEWIDEYEKNVFNNKTLKEVLWGE